MIGNKIVEGGNLVRFLLKIGVVCENYIVGFSFSFIKKMEGNYWKDFVFSFVTWLALALDVLLILYFVVF